MIEKYLEKNELTSCVSISERAAQAVGPAVTALLQDSGFIKVRGMSLERGLPASRMATSLRWIENESVKHPDFADGFPLLECYDEQLDRFIGYIALPQFGFDLSPCRTSQRISSCVPKMILPNQRFEQGA